MLPITGMTRHSSSDGWRNKTPEIVEAWIAQKTGFFLVAIESDMIIAVGSVTDHGTITLNYVSPHARFRT